MVTDQRADRVGADDLKASIAALGRPLRVLIAEDDATNRMVVVQMLQEFERGDADRDRWRPGARRVGGRL